MLGSSTSVSNPNMVLNTAVAEALSQFYDELEGTAPQEMEDAVHQLIKRAIQKHKKIIFNGNGYSQEWVEEAERRGLYNLPSTPEALPRLIADKNVELFTKHLIFTKEEIFSRYEILLENYVKTIGIESRTLQEMMTKDFLPILSSYAGTVARDAASKKALLPGLSTDREESLVNELSQAYTDICQDLEQLKEVTCQTGAMENMQEAANASCRKVLPVMEAIRATASAAEAKIPDQMLGYPTYDQLLFSL